MRSAQAVAIEADQKDFGDRGRRRMEAVEPAGIGKRGLGVPPRLPLDSVAVTPARSFSGDSDHRQSRRGCDIFATSLLRTIR